MKRTFIVLLFCIIAASAHAAFAIFQAYNPPPINPTFVLPTGSVLHYMSPTGSDAANGLTPGTAWLTPNHAMNCGEAIIEAGGALTGSQLSTNWGAVSNCPSTTGGIDGTGGINFAIVLCAGPTLSACPVTGTVFVKQSHWAVEGFTATNSGADFSCFTGKNGTSNVAFVAFINDIASTCDGNGFDTETGSTNGVGSFDQTLFVGLIAYNAARANDQCYSGVSIIPTNSTTSSSEPHVYAAAIFSYTNIENNGCGGTDGEGIILDSAGCHGFTHAETIEQSAVWNNGSAGYEVFPNSGCTGSIGTDKSDVIVNRSTAYSNEQDPQHNSNGIAEMFMNEIAIASNATKTITNNLFQATLATPGGSSPAGCAGSNTGCAVLAYGAGGTPINSSFTTITGNFFKGVSPVCAGNGGTCDGTNTVVVWDGNLLPSGSTNTIATAPGFANPGGLPLGAPDCHLYTNVTDCMNTGYSVAADLRPTGGAAGLGYQPPGPCAANANFPTWAKGVIRLQWNSGSSTITEMSDLMTKPCGM